MCTTVKYRDIWYSVDKLNAIRQATTAMRPFAVSTAATRCVFLDGCGSPPYVENATAQFDQLNNSVTLTCIKGLRTRNDFLSVNE